MFIINIAKFLAFVLGFVELYCYQYPIKSINNLKLIKDVSKRYCVGTAVTPLPQPEGQYRTDADTSWLTIKKEEIIPISVDKFSVRPQLITFDAYNTLFQPSQSIGRWYREVLNDACDMRIRLPRPALFNHAFKSIYLSMCQDHPCFGASTGMSSKEWWYNVIENTYLTTRDLTELEPIEIKNLMPKLFEMLYTNVFGTKEGWIVKEDVEYTLTKLKEWRDLGSGPKIGVISNFDDRLHKIMSDLNIAHYFDFILTSQECNADKPNVKMFNKAMEIVKCDDVKLAFHIGDSIDHDVEGAFAAGWTAFRYNEWFDDDFPDWNAIDQEESADVGADSRRALMLWGRKAVSRHPEKGGLNWVEIWGLDEILALFGFPEDPSKPVRTTVLRGFLGDEAPSQNG